MYSYTIQIQYLNQWTLQFQTECEKNVEIFRGILLIPHNTGMDMNNAMLWF